MSGWLLLLVYAAGMAYSGPKFAQWVYADNQSSWDRFTSLTTKDSDREDAVLIGICGAILWPLAWVYIGVRKFIIIGLEDKS
jgi:hypothetical protein